MILLDGKTLRDKILNNLKNKIRDENIHPHFAIITTNNNDGADIFINEKIKMANFLGYNCDIIKFDVMVSQEEIINRIDELNCDSSIHGILVTLPLPKHIDRDKVINSILPSKDIDGLTGKSKELLPSTANGIVTLLDEYNLLVKGKNVVVMGKGPLVGNPLSKILTLRGLDVTVCDSKTNNLEDHTRKADIIISGTGVVGLIKKEMVKDGVILVDAGISKRGNAFLGDIDKGAYAKASYATPVPGGVGPMTVAMLAQNIYLSYKLQGDNNDR